MNTTLEYRRLEYLQEVAKKYIPENRKWWHSEKKQYELISPVAQRSRSAPATMPPYEIRLAKPFAYIIISLIFFYLLFYRNDHFKISDLWNPPLLFFIALLLKTIFEGFFDRRIKILLDEDGISFNNCEEYIAWKDVIAIYLETIDNDGETHKLIIHYYYEAFDLFTESSFSIDGYDKKCEEICTAIQELM